ncbi:MAG: cytochrome c biogenesis protein CcsA [Micrococcales bacterium]|nr:cytochrome c biogenesis protein CcsA [Micrococcales bacterium]
MTEDISGIANVTLVTAIVFVVLGLVANIALLSSQQRVNAVARRKVLVRTGADADADETKTDDAGKEATGTSTRRSGGLDTYATGFVVIALIAVTVYLVVRWVKVGHGPFSNGHEFSMAFAWGMLAAYLVAEWRFRLRVVSFAVLPVVAGALVYSLGQGSAIRELPDPLQHSLLLTLHVGFAVISYGAAAVSFGAAVAYLWDPKWLRVDRERLDELGYKAASVTFPTLTVMILVGALWGQISWSRYWAWDPKETAALVTWLFYGAYLHARVSRGWQGKGSAVMLIIGFGLIIFAYFSSYFLGGQHAYV